MLRQNYFAVTVELFGQCCVFVSDAKNQQLVEFQAVSDKIQNQIVNCDGLRLKLGRTGREKEFKLQNDIYKQQMLADYSNDRKDPSDAPNLIVARENLRFEDPAPVQYQKCRLQNNPDIESVDYYVTSLQKPEIAKTIAYTIFQTTGEKSTYQKCLDILPECFRRFNKDNRPVLEEGDDHYVYLTVNYNGINIPCKLKLSQRR